MILRVGSIGVSAFNYIVFAGVALGVLQLTVGVAIGLWLGRRRSGGNGIDSQRAARLASDLRGITDSVATSVRRHNAAIEDIDRRLREETQGADPRQSDDPLTKLVVGVVGQMLSANQQLHNELHQAQDDLRRQATELDQHRQEAMTDALTELPNRRALEDHLRANVDAWRKHGAPFCVMIMDIDHFKRFNDTYGHQAGDEALRQFGAAINGALRKQDVVCRYGGEEFALLLPHTTLEEARGAVGKLRQAIHDLRVDVKGEPVPVTASGGLACIETGETSDALVARADEALYDAKEAGRDRVHQHTGVEACPLDAEIAPALVRSELSQGVRDACDDLRSGMDAWLSGSSH